MEDPLLVNETIGAPEPVNENYFWVSFVHNFIVKAIVII